MRGFVAGASGGVGRGGGRALGAAPVGPDGRDAAAVGEAVAKAGPEVVVHEMTAIPPAFGLRHFDRTFAVTNELRTRGLDHLLAAAAAAGAARFIAQSYTGWPNARTGGLVKTEEDPLDPDPPAGQRESLAAIRHLEQAVLGATGLTGVALRYANLYGPGASDQVVAMIAKRRFPVIGDG